MAYHGGPTRDAVSGAGASALSKLLPTTLNFYAALRRLECTFRTRPRFGEAVDLASEPLRFGQDPSLAFRAATLTSVFEGNEHKPARVGVSYFGMLAANGPFPKHLVQYIEDRRRHHGDATWIGFLDIFQHRLITLFYRAWANSQPTVNRDRPESDRFVRYVGALVGLGRGGAAPAAVDDASLYNAIHFAAQTRHAEGLAKSLSACFGVAVAIEEFVGQWLDIPAEFQWNVPSSAAVDGGAIGVLGESTRVGTQLWDRSAKFRVVVGPLGLTDYPRFLPGGESLQQLIELVQRYAGPELSWDLRLVLRESDRRPTVLGDVGLLGLTSNLGQLDQTDEFEELVIDPQSLG